MRRSARNRALWGAAVALWLGGCTGEIGDKAGLGSGPGGPGDPVFQGDPVFGGQGGGAGAGGAGGTGASGGGDKPIADPSAALECVTPAVGATPMQRLTHREYDNAVRDLLGLSTAPAEHFVADPKVGHFDNTTTQQNVSVVLADQYLVAAEELALAANVPALLGCDATELDCVRGFVERFGRRAYRRPLESEETERLLAVYSAHAAETDAVMGARGVIAAVLASPYFLFRPEFGGVPSALPEARVLTGYEVAGRLSTLLWASVPDDELLDAAAAGELDTPAGVETQARRMLAHARSRAPQWDFYAQWFGLEMLAAATKDPSAYPAFNDALRASMAEETRRYVEHVLWNADGRLHTLLSADYSFVDGALAALYGVPAPAASDTFAQASLDTAQRRGLISQASLMTGFAAPAESSPAKRGKWVRTRILCQDLPDPPNNIPELPEPMEGISTRERFARHTSDPACSSCHRMIDGLGFGLEHYDGIGAYRTMDHGAAVDASGQINGTRDIDGAYSGGPELAAKLAGSAQVRDCAATQWFRYSQGRRETTDDTCSLVALRDAFEASDGDLRELLVALSTTDAFLSYRAPQ